MSANREEILENFMVVTRIENVEEAIIWLECCDWDLTSAVKTSSPEEVKLQNDVYCRNGCSSETGDVAENGVIDSTAGEVSGLRVIQVYVVHGSRIHMVRVPDNISVHCFKRLISFSTNIPPCQQVITGWVQEPSSDTDVLSFMPNSSFVELKDTSKPPEEDCSTEMELSNDSLEMEEQSFFVNNFKILDQSHDKTYCLKVPENCTVAQVKMDVFLLTEIPPSCQMWFGWPEGSADNAEIGNLLLDKPTHSLVVQKMVNPSSPVSIPSPVTTPADDFLDIEESSEINGIDSEEFDENVFNNDNRQCLIPDSIEDEMAGSVHFLDSYTVRYGNATPCFFTGTLEDALKEAYLRPIRERKMLAVYIHHDESVLSNVFCTELLGSEATHQILSSYFVIWGWDITSEKSRSMLMLSAARALGSSFTRTLDNIGIDSFPALFVIAPTRSRYELINVLYGNNGLNELLSMLVNSVEIFSSITDVEAKDEEERAARQKIKHDQDTAYEQSLEMDRAKDEAKRQKLLEKNLEEERLKKEVELEKERKLAEVAMVESQLPSEPCEEEFLAKPNFTFKFRTPDGETFSRRFLSSDNLIVLFNFLFVKGYDVEHYKYITGWPRKDLTLLHPETVLGDLGIFNQETIILEAR